MNSLLTRILVNGGFVFSGLGLFGVLFGQIAASWVASQAPIRAQLESTDGSPNVSSDHLPEQVKWRVPVTMASLGLGLVVVFELLGTLWRKPKVASNTKPLPSDEELIQRLLKEAEQNPGNTPAPAGQLTPEALPVSVN